MDTNSSLSRKAYTHSVDDLVLDKTIFSNVFEKDVRRVFIYKKAERIAKVLHLIFPAFKDSRTLKDKLERISVGLVDSSVLPLGDARREIFRELLSLSSVLEMARVAGHLSPMNAEVIMKEVHTLLGEVASYEEPKVLLEETPSLALLAKTAPKDEQPLSVGTPRARVRPVGSQGHSKGQIVNGKRNGRREAIVSVLKTKGASFIKDLSLMIRGVSEKTIQRELLELVREGKVKRTGERRWTTYELIKDTDQPVGLPVLLPKAGEEGAVDPSGVSR